MNSIIYTRNFTNHVLVMVWHFKVFFYLFHYYLPYSTVVRTTPACTWWNRPEEDLSSDKLESTHPSRTVVKSIEVFYGVESVVRGNADSFLN